MRATKCGIPPQEAKGKANMDLIIKSNQGHIMRDFITDMKEQEKRYHTFLICILTTKPNRISQTKTSRKHIKNSRIFWRETMNKYAVYERIKAEIARTAKSAKEYEKRIKALQRKLKI